MAQKPKSKKLSSSEKIINSLQDLYDNYKGEPDPYYEYKNKEKGFIDRQIKTPEFMVWQIDQVCDLSEGTIRTWLKRLVSEGKVKKRSNIPRHRLDSTKYYYKLPHWDTLIIELKDNKFFSREVKKKK